MTIRVPVAGGEMSAYMSLPKKGKGAGVVVLQEIFGVNESMRKVCDFLAIAPVHRDLPRSVLARRTQCRAQGIRVRNARALRGKMNDDQVTDDIASAIDFSANIPPAATEA